MYGYEDWTIKKAEYWRVDAFELWCWRRLLSVPWTANQSILKEINPEYSLEGLIPKLKLQYFGHLKGRVGSLEKSLMLGKIKGKNKIGGMKDKLIRWHHRLNGHEFEQIPEDNGGQRSLVCYSPWVTNSQARLSDWITTMLIWSRNCWNHKMVKQVTGNFDEFLEAMWTNRLVCNEKLEKRMTTHSSTLAWRIPWTEELDRLQSVGSQTVGHDWATEHTHTCNEKLLKASTLLWLLLSGIPSGSQKDSLWLWQHKVKSDHCNICLVSSPWQRPTLQVKVHCQSLITAGKGIPSIILQPPLAFLSHLIWRKKA